MTDRTWTAAAWPVQHQPSELPSPARSAGAEAPPAFLKLRSPAEPQRCDSLSEEGNMKKKSSSASS